MGRFAVRVKRYSGTRCNKEQHVLSCSTDLRIIEVDANDRICAQVHRFAAKFCQCCRASIAETDLHYLAATTERIPPYGCNILEQVQPDHDLGAHNVEALIDR